MCFHQGTTAPGQAGIVRGDRARLQAIVDEQLSIVGRLQVNTSLAMMGTLADHLERLRRRLLSTARGVKGTRALMHDIYGVGPLSSLALCAWLGGADRFTSSRRFRSTSGSCGCRQSRPCSSGGVFVFVEESAEPIVSADVQMCDRGGAGDRFGQRM